PGEDVRDAAPRTQGGDTGGRRRPAATRARGAAAQRASRARPGGDAGPAALLRRLRLRVVRELRGGAGGMNINGVAIEDTFAAAAHRTARPDGPHLSHDGLLRRVTRRPPPDRLAVGKALRVFGDGFQASKVIGGKRYWRLPVMEGEFLVEETFGMLKGVGGGNFLILAQDADAALAAAEAAVVAMTSLRGVILPFPGGVVRSGSKVGSTRYKNLVATTND